MEPDVAKPLPDYSFAAAFSLGWTSFKRQYPLLLAVSIVYLVIVSAVGGVGYVVLRTTGFNYVSPIAFFLLYPHLGVGLVLTGGAMARGHRPDFAEMFAGYRALWPIAGIQFFLFLMAMPFALVIVVVTATIVAFGGGGGLGLGVIIILAVVGMVALVGLWVRFLLAEAIVADPRMPRMDLFAALRLSWALTSGVWPSLIGLGIVLGLLSMIAMAMLVLPAIFLAVPLMVSVYGAAYAMLAQRAADLHEGVETTSRRAPESA